MSKVNYCFNGRSVSDQVVLYQQTRQSEDFLPIMLYYDNFKDVWYKQIEDYLDRMTFEAEFDFRLVRAVDTYNHDQAVHLCQERGYSTAGMFNRWFYKILTNWKSNVKTSSFRLKKRPAVKCPICGRNVGRIDESHLRHIKTTSDLPKFMTWKGEIYEVMLTPRVYASNWGRKTIKKWRDLQAGNIKEHVSDKRRVRWPWRLKDGHRGVLCPLSKKIVPEINDKFLESLPDSVNRYATPMSWMDFIQEHPTALIQSEIYSLDHVTSHADDGACLRDHVSRDLRIGSGSSDDVDVSTNDPPARLEHVFTVIDKCVENGIDRKILKFIASGYSLDDIGETLEMERKDIRKRVRHVRDSSKGLEGMLLS